MNPSTAPSTALTKLTVDALLGTYVKQGYLEKQPNALAGATQKSKNTQDAEKNEGGDPTMEWRWGPRADIEMGETNVAKFIGEFYREPEETEPATVKLKKDLLHKKWVAVRECVGVVLMCFFPIAWRERLVRRCNLLGLLRVS